ncbi:hypothetical protein EUGRSUZ_C03230 [Eucalyptus grandis]|uniref:Uncharacterized protein n=2 Tax=Eucalyptus grandis TaxID=71139 RepID=A0ACC3LHU0_EUCGR|nr:hypothetical protein EUGRSUZ_C03230 [Eucalyptus grandis]
MKSCLSRKIPAHRWARYLWTLLSIQGIDAFLWLYHPTQARVSVLLLIGRFKCKDMHEEDMIMASLICIVDFGCQKLLVCK